MTHVAIVGAGPGGLAAARWLRSQGLRPEMFESHSDIGGQWNLSNPNSGVWPQMRTRTDLCATHCSDLDCPEGTAIFPRNQKVLRHLRDLASAFGPTLSDVTLHPDPPGLAFPGLLVQNGGWFPVIEARRTQRDHGVHDPSCRTGCVARRACAVARFERDFDRYGPTT